MNSTLTSKFKGSRHVISKTVTANYTFDDEYEDVNVDATSGPITITLPAIATYPGRLLTVRKVDNTTNVVTIAAAGADLIQGNATTTLAAQWKVISLSNNNSSQWYVSNGDGGANVVTGASTYTFIVAPAIAINDPVYVSATNTAALADATSVTTAPCVGFVTSKPTATSAIVQTNGFLTGFSGLVAGDTYFLAVGGGITTTPPNTVGNIIQKLGIAISSTVIWVQPVLDFTIR
jgi:hypothetical protein